MTHAGRNAICISHTETSVITDSKVPHHLLILTCFFFLTLAHQGGI